ncbi:diacylglycerol kinase [Ahniella affigens]|uniref:Dihydrofolate reductase n=2 Tax=Ahniella affigens TaxID=2021234 RepID=A0A2P1PZH8_9GAMM|nr:diacylglycerol kinase [Ahniella affigens]
MQRPPEIALIAALDSARAIGFDNQLPWHLPDDLKRFKALTQGQTILMGRRTAESLGRSLPKRQNLVLSRHDAVPFAGMTRVPDLATALAHCDSERLWVIGGGEIYALCLPLARFMALTHVHTTLTQADTYFPAFSASDWQLERSTEHAADDHHAFGFQFADYRRVEP